MLRFAVLIRARRGRRYTTDGDWTLFVNSGIARCSAHLLKCSPRRSARSASGSSSVGTLPSAT
eukprot:9583268-Alexandrium_andersonii.AAC.1